MADWNIVESGVKHHNHNPNYMIVPTTALDFVYKYFVSYWKLSGYYFNAYFLLIF
jgi:hypothetical protein